MSFSLRSRHFLSQWITALLPAVPTRSRATFVELLCACLVSPEGWVTRAIGSIGRRCHWTTYYKLIERGSVRSVPLARALLTLVQSVLPLQTLNLVIDDTLALRHSPDAPGSAVRHDHANKTNRPDFVKSQCWVTLGVSVLGHGKAKLVLPILSRIVPHTGNRNKLTIALALLRVLAPVLTVPTRLLCDSWFMRARLVLPLLSRGIQVIAQARIDTALFLPPDATGKSGRGRPRKYGQRLTAEAIADLPLCEMSLTLHGKGLSRLDNTDEKVQRETIFLLGKIKDTRVVDRLISLLKVEIAIELILVVDIDVSFGQAAFLGDWIETDIFLARKLQFNRF